MSTTVRETVYYTRELVRRLRHYTAKCRDGYRDRGTLEDAAETILERRLEGGLEEYGNFLEVYTLDGGPYIKRGYASAEDVTVAAALWVQYRDRRGGGV